MHHFALTSIELQLPFCWLFSQLYEILLQSTWFLAAWIIWCHLQTWLLHCSSAPFQIIYHLINIKQHRPQHRPRGDLLHAFLIYNKWPFIPTFCFSFFSQLLIHKWSLPLGIWQPNFMKNLWPKVFCSEVLMSLLYRWQTEAWRLRVKSWPSRNQWELYHWLQRGQDLTCWRSQLWPSKELIKIFSKHPVPWQSFSSQMIQFILCRQPNTVSCKKASTHAKANHIL